ncbi:hypothetical protein ACFLTP_01825 [Chloroflexota bacterium]
MPGLTKSELLKLGFYPDHPLYQMAELEEYFAGPIKRQKKRRIIKLKPKPKNPQGLNKPVNQRG